MNRPEVLVFLMDGCQSCHELRPIAERLHAHYATCIDTRFIDVDSEANLADAMGVEETPTVIGVINRQPVIRMVGHDGSPDRLVQVYSKMVEGVVTCTVDRFRDV